MEAKRCGGGHCPVRVRGGVPQLELRQGDRRGQDPGAVRHGGGQDPGPLAGRRQLSGGRRGRGNAGAAGEAGTAGDAGNVQSSGEPGSAYFATARLNRQQARDSALSLLQDAAAREDADETVKNQLNDNIQTMADYTVTEAQIENLVVAKGYADCVAFIGEDTLSLAVAAPEGGLTEADTAKIVDVVNRTAGFTADQISIIEVE